MIQYRCQFCKNLFNTSQIYEYRGAYACEEHFDKVVDSRNFERKQIIEEESRKTEVFRGLDLDPTSPLGKVNRDILKRQIEIAGKESAKLKNYELSFKATDGWYKQAAEDERKASEAEVYFLGLDNDYPCRICKKLISSCEICQSCADETNNNCFDDPLESTCGKDMKDKD